jgi:hypothetical protein
MRPHRILAACLSLCLVSSFLLATTPPLGIVHAAPDSERKPHDKPADKPKDTPGFPSPTSAPAGKTPSDTPSASDASSAGEGGFFEQCLAGLFEGCMTSICDSFFSGGEKKKAAAAAQAAHYEWKVNEHGWLRASAPTDSVSLWRKPYGADSSDVETGMLADDTEVVVTEIHESDQGVELLVRPVDAVEPSGYVSGALVATTRRPAAAPAAPAAPADSARVAPVPSAPADSARVAPVPSAPDTTGVRR